LNFIRNNFAYAANCTCSRKILRKLFRKRKAATALIPATMFCRDQRADAISSAKSKEEHCQNKQGRYEILRRRRDWFGSTRDSSESSSAAASCCSRSNEQHRDPHDEIQPAGRRKTDGGQIIDDHPFASHRRTPFSTKPSSRSDAGSLTSQISWPRCLGLQGCFSNANPMP
jgi:hypothetical protein